MEVAHNLDTQPQDFATQLRAAGLSLPPVPAHLQPSFVWVAPWLYSTRQDTHPPYDLRHFLLEAGTQRIDDYLLVGVDGRGVNSYAFHYYLVLEHLALFLQVSWGGAYTDNAESAQELARYWPQVEALIAAAQQADDTDRFAAGQRLFVTATSRDGCHWVWAQTPMTARPFMALPWQEEKEIGQALVVACSQMEGK